MRLPVVWTAEAIADLVEAQDWYEGRLSSLGERFAMAVNAAIEAIADNPRQLPIRHKRLRRAGVRRFHTAYSLISKLNASWS